jgi:imidazolonepropionase-like amidohydrolase
MSNLYGFLFGLLLAASIIGPAAAEPAIVILAARWLDVTSGKIQTPATIVVEGRIIKSVGAAETPSGAQVIDLGDVTLLPGLIDAHTHLTLDFEGDWANRPVTELPADSALRGARNAVRTLEAGFTTVRDVGAPGFADISLARAIDAGLISGPRVIPSGHAISITGGHCDDMDGRQGSSSTDPKLVSLMVWTRR